MLTAEDYVTVRQIAQEAATAAAQVAIRHNIVSGRVAKLGAWLTIEQAAAVLEISTDAVKTAMREKRLLAAKGGKEIAADSVVLYSLTMRRKGDEE